MTGAPPSAPQEYLAVLSTNGVRAVDVGTWLFVGDTVLRPIAWKLHVSAGPETAVTVLDRVVPLLKQANATFKVCRSRQLLQGLNRGVFGASQVGKFLTVYPTSDEVAAILAHDLISVGLKEYGPAVPTDLHLGANVYARFGSVSPRLTRDRLGLFRACATLDDGSTVADDYHIPFSRPEAVACPFEPEPERPWQDICVAGRFLVVAVCAVNPEGATYIALDASPQASEDRLVVLKEARAHCGRDRAGESRSDRLVRERKVLDDCASAVRVPRALDMVPHDTSRYLVLEYVRGTPVGASDRPWHQRDARSRLTLLEQWWRVAECLERLHRQGWVHGDVKRENILCADERICLIDFETARRIDCGELSSGLVTLGFGSPQQARGDQLSTSDDVFGLGGVFLAGVSGLLPSSPFWSEASVCDLLRTRFGLPEALSIVISACRSALAEARPSLSTIMETIAREREREVRGENVVPSGAQGYDAPRTMLESAMTGLLRRTLVDTRSGMWLSNSHDMRMPFPSTTDGYSLFRSGSRGVAGVLYCLAKFHGSGVTSDALRVHARRAIEWLLAGGRTPDGGMPGLFFGEAGVAVSLAEAVGAGLVTSNAAVREAIALGVSGELRWPDLTHGASGQGLAAMNCFARIGDRRLLDVAADCAAYLVRGQDVDGGWTIPDGIESPAGRRYTGFAHGAAGIVYFLAHYGAILHDRAAFDAATRGGRWLLEQEGASGRRGTWPVETTNEEVWYSWCNGGPGIALGLMKLYEHGAGAAFGDAARRAIAALPDNLHWGRLSQCCGASGVAETYLEAARVFGDRKWTCGAESIGRQLASLRSQDKDGIVWCVDGKATADLMIGSGGIAHALLRIAGACEGGPMWGTLPFATADGPAHRDDTSSVLSPLS